MTKRWMSLLLAVMLCLSLLPAGALASESMVDAEEGAITEQTEMNAVENLPETVTEEAAVQDNVTAEAPDRVVVINTDQIDDRKSEETQLAVSLDGVSGWAWPIPSSTSLTQGYSSSHTGVDIAANIGDPIYAPQDGTIYHVYTGCTRYGGLSTGVSCRNAGVCNPNHGYCTASGTAYGYCNNGYGNGICLLTTDGIYVQFAHMQSVASGLYEGKTVTKGTLLGYVGGSGCATGKHCHYAVNTISEFSSSGFFNPMNISYSIGGSSSGTINVGGNSVTVDFASNSRQSIGKDEITVARIITVTGASITSIGEVGIEVYDSQGNYVAGKSEKPQTNGSHIDVWYTLKDELGMTLVAGATYSYKFFAKINGTTYYSVSGSGTVTVPGAVEIPTLTNVTVSGTSVSVTWTASEGASSYDVYLIQQPWNWADVKYSASSTGTSHTFYDVAIGYYQAFVIARPNDATRQSNWYAFSISNPTFSVTYNANGGTGAPAAQTKTSGTALTLSSVKPTRSGYTFLGWATSSAATVAMYQPGGTYTQDADITLYAKWSKNAAAGSGSFSYQNGAVTGTYSAAGSLIDIYVNGQGASSGYDSVSIRYTPAQAVNTVEVYVDGTLANTYTVSGGTGTNTYTLDLSGVSITANGVSGEGRIVRTGGSQAAGKLYAYVVVNYERADGSTWSVAGTYSADSDGLFDMPTIAGVSDRVTRVVVIGLDAKVGANWAGHNITKPAVV